MTIMPRQELRCPRVQLCKLSALVIRDKSRKRSTYAVLKFHKRIGRQVYTRSIAVGAPNLEVGEFASGPGLLNRDLPESNVIPVHIREETGTGATFCQPRPPFQTKRGAAGDPVGVERLTVV